MMRSMKTHLLLMVLLTPLLLMAQVDVDYEAGVTVNASSGQFAPYYIASNRGGTITQSKSFMAHGALWHELDTTRRFSYGFGAELWTGFASSAEYDRYDPETQHFNPVSQHPSRAWAQQIYAQVKYRGVLATLGAKAPESVLVDNRLSSGDLIMSGNARPPIGFELGFVNFQNFPFTKGWLQIQGKVGYYKPGDGKWMENHYNYYNHFVSAGLWLHYKQFQLRTKPSQPVMFSIGAQAACQFAGSMNTYSNGVLVSTMKMPADLKAFFRTIIAGSGGSNPGDKFVEGNHLGSWDIALRYRLPSGHIVRGYHQRIWEDGSGIGMLNGFDGLWGIEYRSPHKGIINAAVVEYLDLTNQSGPIHWAPKDFEGTAITKQATGNDDYYNNYTYNGYQIRGMSVGSPFVKSPLYNTDGYLRYTDNMMRGFHLALTGNIIAPLEYRAMLSFRKTWGTPFLPRPKPLTGTSIFAEVIYRPVAVPGLSLTAQVGVDRGTLYGNNFGALLSLAYHGNFTIGR